MAQGQSPSVMYIGCSDSRVVPNEIIGLRPGDMFVHRNIANVVAHSDLNLLSVLQYAVDALGVQHIVVCGHYGCGGVAAALDNKPHGLVDNWLRYIGDTYRLNRDRVDAIDDQKLKCDLMTELNVLNSVYNVCKSPIVQQAWARGQNLTVHAWCYRLQDGLIRDLGLDISKPESVDAIYDKVMKEKTEPEYLSEKTATDYVSAREL
ncbi:hypothetical protein HK104_006733 [Borealophlyctis nickersoniae]|nr:hypothetical protein HK104_006733 [Borealophlyctis nickersoniae]